MSTEVGLFWLIHLFIGVVLPVMVLSGCCREQEDAIPQKLPVTNADMQE